ncbi:transketolase [Enterococcus cecorum]|nr:transketolase [Enterococcus cecorum]
MNDVKKIKKIATQIRLDTLLSLEKMGQGHLGGSFSIVELLAVLYGKYMKFNPKDIYWQDRDYLVLSKGHAGVGLYSTLANFGFFDKSMLATINQGGTSLPSHPDRLKTPGVDVTTGSLGQGTSIAAGIATGLRLQNKENDVYLIVGDGELNEGQCWEAFQYIAHQKLNHCIVIIDDNKKQLDGFTTDIINQFDLKKKFESFGFYTIQVKGNDVNEIDWAISESKSVKNQAVCIILDTTKGQGIPFFEHYSDNHSVKFQSDEIKKETKKAIEYLQEVLKELDE